VIHGRTPPTLSVRYQMMRRQQTEMLTHSTPRASIYSLTTAVPVALGVDLSSGTKSGLLVPRGGVFGPVALLVKESPMWLQE
jgi:hypothetical protein